MSDTGRILLGVLGSLFVAWLLVFIAVKYLRGTARAAAEAQIARDAESQ
jgi:hypothetical protein